MDCSLPGSSVHGILQARILTYAAISFSPAFSPPRDQSCIARWILYQLSYQGSYFWSIRIQKLVILIFAS